MLQPPQTNQVERLALPFRLDGGYAASQQDQIGFAPSLERRRLQCHLAQIVVDIAAIAFGFVIFGALYSGIDGIARGLTTAELVVPIFLTVALYNGAYSIASLKSAITGSARASVALAIGVTVILFFAFIAKASDEFSRAITTGGFLLTLLTLIWARLQMRAFVRWRCGVSIVNELAVDDGGPELAYEGLWHANAAELELKPDLNDPHALARFGQVVHNMDRVIISCPPERRAAWAMILKSMNIEGEVLDDEVVRLGALGARVAGDHGMLLVSTGPLGLRSRATKRAFDLALTSAALVALAPLFVLVALAIKLEDGGSIFFKQRRLGRGNRFFDIYKFRSMSEAKADSDGTVSASRDDQRVTRIGRFIRRTSIDELPQLLNVLAGDMSLVGPRPHAIGSQAGDKLFWEVDQRYWERHALKPGLSGLAQIRGFRGATDHEIDLVDRLRSDLEYIEGWTILRDVKIIALTLRVLIHERAF